MIQYPKRVLDSQLKEVSTELCKVGIDWHIITEVSFNFDFGNKLTESEASNLKIRIGIIINHANLDYEIYDTILEIRRSDGLEFRAINGYGLKEKVWGADYETVKIAQTAIASLDEMRFGFISDLSIKTFDPSASQIIKKS